MGAGSATKENHEANRATRGESEMREAYKKSHRDSDGDLVLRENRGFRRDKNVSSFRELYKLLITLPVILLFSAAGLQESQHRLLRGVSNALFLPKGERTD
jgi:hypothetical protein